MRSKFIEHFLRKRLNNPTMYSYLRRVLLLMQFVLKSADEPDFKIFRSLKCRADGLVIDIGANGGQSAVGFAIHCPGFKIQSFEPNPQLWAELDFIAKIIGKNFAYKKIGLGDERGSMPLYIPSVGNLPISTRASLSREYAMFQVATLEEQLKQPTTVVQNVAVIERFDNLDLNPDAIKIDVEGCEFLVLNGMRHTLSRCQPALMLENNDAREACQAYLARFGYEFFERDRESGGLITSNGQSSRNWFALTPNRFSEFGVMRG